MPHLTPSSVAGDGITLRPWSDADVDALVRRINDPELAIFLDTVPQPYTADDAREWVAITAEDWRTGTSATFAIHAEAIDGAVGGIGVRFLGEPAQGSAEVGYWVAAEARGRGIATAATRAVARWAFETVAALERLQLRAMVENAASNRVAEKAGFTREGVLRAERLNVRLGRRVDFVMSSLLREEL